jgi:uncharacterized protein (UPF0548 family)
MLSLHKPTIAQIARQAEFARTDSFTSPGDLIARVDRNDALSGWNVDHICGAIGSGDEAFAVASAAIAGLVASRQSWLTIHQADPYGLDAVIGTEVRVGPIWSTNWCRITSIVDESKAFGFTYTTTTEHGESGEERFEVRLADDGTVSFDLLAVSRPGRWYTKLTRPLLRLMQARFRRDAATLMAAAVATAPLSVG